MSDDSDVVSQLDEIDLVTQRELVGRVLKYLRNRSDWRTSTKIMRGLKIHAGELHPVLDHLMVRGEVEHRWNKKNEYRYVAGYAGPPGDKLDLLRHPSHAPTETAELPSESLNAIADEAVKELKKITSKLVEMAYDPEMPAKERVRALQSAGKQVSDMIRIRQSIGALPDANRRKDATSQTLVIAPTQASALFPGANVAEIVEGNKQKKGRAPA